MLEMVEDYIKSFYYEGKAIPVMHMRESRTTDEPLPAPEDQMSLVNREALRSRLLRVEEAMASFLEPSFLRPHRTIHQQNQE